MKANRQRFLEEIKRLVINVMMVLVMGGSFSVTYAQVCGSGTNLVAGRWTMISLPCLPNSNTVHDVFADDLGAANYDVRWVVYERSKSTDTYIKLSLISTLNQGESYWILSLDNAATGITGTATPLTTGNPNCPSMSGCFEAILAPPGTNSSTRQNMIGHPFPFSVHWADVIIEVDGVAYSPSAAQTAGLVSKTINKYSGNSYSPFDDVTPGMEGILNIYDGFWLETLGGSAGKTAKLLFSDPNQPPVAANDSYNFSASVDQNVAAGTGLFVDNGSGADSPGTPAASLASYGGGSLGGTVTDNAAGASVALAGGTLTVNADGSWAFTGQPFTPGTYSFGYRLTNTSGTSDATVTLEIVPTAACNDDSYSVTGNVGINSINGINQGVLFNDAGMPISVTAFDTNSNNGGSVNVLTNGEFTYTPPAGFTGADSFTYTANGTLTCTVNITISDMIWFIDNSQAANGDGRLSSPFNSLTNFNSGAADLPGDSIFVYRQSATSYAGPLMLLNNQKLIGQGAMDSIVNITAITLAPLSDALPGTGGMRPVITHSTNNLTLAQNNRVRGLDITNSGGTALTGSNFGSLTISEISVNNTSGVAISLNTGVLDANFTSVSSNGGANGIVLNSTTGNFSVTGSGTTNASGGTIQNNSFTGVSLTNTSNISLKNLTLSGTHGDFAIRGIGVNNLVMNNVRLTGTSGNNIISDEGGVLLTDIAGNLDVDGGVYGGGIEDNFAVNNSSGTVNATFDNVTFSTNHASSGDNNLQFITSGTATGNLSVNSSTFSGGRSLMLFTDIGGSGGGAINIGNTAGNTFTQNQIPVPGGGAIEVAASGSGNSSTVTTYISNNTVLAGSSRFEGDTIVISTGPGFAGTHNLTMSGNTIGISGINGSAVNFNTGQGDSGIVLSQNGTATFTSFIDNNDIFDFNAGGIEVFFDAEGSPVSGVGGTINLTITNNTITEPSGGTSAAIEYIGDDRVDVCSHIFGNTLANPTDREITVDNFGDALATFTVPGLVTLTEDGIEILYAGNNGGLTPDTDVKVFGMNHSIAGGGACPTP